MKLIARVRVTVDVPFTADIPDPIEMPSASTHPKLEPADLEKQRKAAAKQAAVVERARREAAKEAQALGEKLKTSTGAIVEVVVEEVREA